ncbi:MAG: hypothetical protein R3E54_11100 [Halioglobus sp.]
MCNHDPTYEGANPNEYVFNDGDQNFVVFDESVEADMRLNITSNTRLDGSHINTGDMQVVSSSVVGIKLHGSSPVFPGETNLSYSLDGSAYSGTGLDVACFQEWRGETSSTRFGNFTSSGHYINFLARVNTQALSQTAAVGLFIAESPADLNSEADMWLSNGESIGGEDTGNVSLHVIESSNEKLHINASAVDDHDPLKSFEFELRLAW